MNKKNFSRQFTMIFTVIILIITAFAAQAQSSAKFIIRQNGKSISKDQAMNSLSKYFSKSELKGIEAVVDQSFTAINAGNKQKLIQSIKDIKTKIKIAGRISQNSYDPTNDCETHCWNKCDDATCYGWCWWSCVIRGGPDGVRTTTTY